MEACWHVKGIADEIPIDSHQDWLQIFEIDLSKDELSRLAEIMGFEASALRIKFKSRMMNIKRLGKAVSAEQV